MFSEHDINLEAVRIALRIQDAHDEYEQAHSMQGSDREANSALYAATNQLARLLHQMHQVQPENPGLMRMLDDFGHAEKGTFMGHAEDWEGGECMRRMHRYAHYHPPPESDQGDEGGCGEDGNDDDDGEGQGQEEDGGGG